MSGVSVISRAVAAVERAATTGRERYEAFDHAWRAVDLYAQVLGGRLAAAIAYYGFFAVFALGLVAYWIFGAILKGSAAVNDVVADFLQQNLPFINPAQILESSGDVGILGLVLLALTGIGWVEAIRSSQRLMYGLNQQPGNLVIRRVVDLAVMIGVFLLLGVSVGAVDVLESLLRSIFGRRSAGFIISGWMLAVVVNVVLASALLVAVPRLRITARRLVPPVLLVALGITLLNTLGRYYIVRAERNPAYTVVAGAVGLLLYLYLLNQLLLFGAALAATSRHGRVIDLAERPASADENGEDEPLL
jgi:membrane protein